MKTSEDLWASALDKIEDKCRQQFVFDHQDPIIVLSDLQSLAETARDESVERRWRFRRPDNGEIVILRDLFDKVVSWINIFKQIGDVAVQYDPQHAALPWAAIRFVLQLAVSDVVKFEFVVEGVESIAHMISRCAIFEAIYLRRQSPATQKLKETLVGLYAAILLYLSKATLFFQQKTSQRLLKGVFIGEKEFQPLSSQILLRQSEVDRYAAMVQAEHHNTMSDALDAIAINGGEKHAKLLQILGAIDGPIHRMGPQLQSLEDHLETSKRTEILRWISSQPYIEHHERIRRTDVPERGKWLLEDSVYTRWHKESVCSLLWLHGKVGSGKTTLTAIVVDDALKRSAAGQNPPPVYFYCSRNAAEPERSNPDAILASIVRQLSCMQPGGPLSPSIIETYARKGQGFSSKGLQLEESRDIILELVEQSRMTTIIIDALDEIDPQNRHMLLQVLEDILQDAAGLVKIFVSSRDDQDIVCTLDEYPSLDVASDKNQRDIEQFVRTETERLIRKRRLLRYSNSKEELKSLIIEQVSKGADGMFRWAALQLEVLCSLKLDADVRTTLGRLPPGLEELYAEIYERQISQYRGEAGRTILSNILKWLLCAQTQMTSSELRVAVAMVLPISAEELNKAQILDLCHNFVIFDDALDTFRFAHLSVREYLETRVEYATVACHVLAGETCLIQLIGSTKSLSAPNFLRVECALDVSNKVASTSESIVGGFHKYSTLYWPKHCASIGEEGRQSNSRFRKLFHFFLSTNSQDATPLDTWMLSYRHREYDEYAPYYLRTSLDEYQGTEITAFFLACAFGFCEILRESLGNTSLGIEERKRGWDIAAFGGQDDALKTLLSRRGEYNISEEFVRLVAENLSQETTVWVLKQAPYIRLTQELIKSASHTKVSGHSGGVDIILDHFDASELSNEVIAAAAQELKASAFQSLLDRRTDIKVSEMMFISASYGKNYDVMRLLLDHPDFQLSTVMLLTAVSRCNVEMIQNILQHGVTTITASAMREATMNQDHGVLQLLLDYGGTISHSVLVSAAGRGYSPLLRMLLDRNHSITRAMLRMGACNWRDGRAVMSLLLAEADDATIKEEMNAMMKIASGNIRRTSEVISMLASRAEGVTISEDVFMALASNGTDNSQYIKLLMNNSGRSGLTAEVKEALANNLRSYESMQLLLNQIENEEASQYILKAAAGNRHFGDELVKVLLDITPLSDVTQCVWNAAVSNFGCGLEVLMLLEDRAGPINVTEELLIRVASEGSPRVMEYLLQRSDDAVVTEMVIASALKAPLPHFWSDMAMVRLLLGRTCDKPISEDLLHLAARDAFVQTFKLFWARYHGQEVPSTLLQAAAKNQYGLKTLEFLIDKSKDLEVGEAIIDAIVGRPDAKKILELCIGRKMSLNITNSVLVRAAASTHAEDELIFLFENAKKFAIDDRTFKAGAASGNQEFLSALSTHCGVDKVESKWTDIAKLHEAAEQRAWYYECDTCVFMNDSCDPDADISLVRDLLAKGVPCDLPDGHGATPLALAAENGNELIAKALLDAGSDPDSRDRKGRSPLFHAVSEGHYEIVLALLGQGVDIDVVDDKGQTMEDRAKKGAHMKVYRLLERYKKGSE